MRCYERAEEWLSDAVSGIKFYYDRYEVREELAAHLEDKIFGLMELYPNLSREDAEKLALERMGDPEEIGHELARIHKPWVGYLWAVSLWAVVLGVGVLVFESFFVLRIILNSDFGILAF